MSLAQRAVRGGLKAKVEALMETAGDDVKAAAQEWLDTYNVGATNGAATDKLVAALEACGCDAAKEILKDKDFLAKKSQWIFGGDGWAYDIGFGGVDHVLASGQDVNVMVFDTEVTPTQADSPPRLLRPVRLRSSLQAARTPRRRTWLPSP